MRRFVGRLVAKRSRGAIAPRAVLVAAALLGAAAVPAGATIFPTTNATTAANAAIGPGFVIPVGAAPALSAPGGNPVGTSDPKTTVVPAFPRDGTNFLVLSTGDAQAADQLDQPGAFPSVDDGGAPIRGIRPNAFDTTLLRIPFNLPGTQTAQSACLSFDFRFLSEEYPAHLDNPFNDIFIAEIDNTTWNTSATGPQITAADNFATVNGQPVTIKSTGPATLAPSEALGTPYGAATAPLHAQVFVPVAVTPPAQTHSLVLSLFDHGDALYDSAVFIDNLRLVAASAAMCPGGVTGLGPAPVITGPTVAATVDSLTPTLTGTASGTGAVTVRLYTGALAQGAPVLTLPAARSGTTWSAVPAAPLAPGQYTAQATQASATPGINGVSSPTTFTVVAPQPQPQQQAQGGASQQLPGDKDGDGIPDDQDTSDGSLPPIPGKTFDARVVSGDVFIKYPAGAGPRAVTPPKGFVPLKGAANIPIGAQLDTRAGRVAVTSAADTGASNTQTADFYDGIFQVKQTLPKKKPAKPAALVTDLVLKGEPARSECAPLKGSASAATATKKKRGAKSVLGSLWGSGKGKFRTNGKYSSATVRGTIWLTQDRCDGTLTTVKRGTVSVRDFKRRTTVTVKAGHSYLARAQRAASKAKGRTK